MKVVVELMVVRGHGLVLKIQAKIQEEWDISRVKVLDYGLKASEIEI